jgi:hypothetical protein
MALVLVEKLIDIVKLSLVMNGSYIKIWNE